MHAQWRQALQIAPHHGLTIMTNSKLTIVTNSKPTIDEALDKVAVLQRAYEREKARRRNAEKILEDKSRTLYLSQEKLNDASQRLQNQNAVITGLSDNYIRVTQDLSYAAKVQNSLLPGSLDLSSIAAAGQFKPAQFIAGDGYDYFLLNKDVLAFYVIDVAGHGIAAAMTSFAVQIQLNPKADGLCQKHFSIDKPLDDVVADIMIDINHMFFHEHPDSQYFTMVLGLIKLKTGEVSFAQAGHPAPILWQSSTELAIPHGKGGTPVAMFDTPSFGIYQCLMKKGDRLLVYSDGVTECRNQQDEEFGENRLIQAMRNSSTQTIQQSTVSITETVTTWNGGRIFEDDLSILLLEYKKNSDE